MSRYLSNTIYAVYNSLALGRSPTSVSGKEIFVGKSHTETFDCNADF